MTAPKGNGQTAINNLPAKFTKCAIDFIAACKRFATDDLTLYMACVTVAIGAALVTLWGTL
jgi:hypothetical protein